MKWRYSAALSVLLVCFIGSIAWSASYYYDKYQTERQRADAAVQAQQQSEAMTAITIATALFINEISRMAHEQKTEIARDGKEAVVYIREALQSNDCAGQSVPVAAADRLRDYADRLRSGTTYPDP
ncbi:hypothetical protein [Entomohabitans teleogrylli]|uniref:hypothetical protein n=1 Tax=Entomohabitans teleogrylli TaxID=1384589 RepID=UPI0008FC90E1|nr:hypothetical protein [Entomohabitans teleogrylli]